MKIEKVLVITENNMSRDILQHAVPQGMLNFNPDVREEIIEHYKPTDGIDYNITVRTFGGICLKDIIGVVLSKNTRVSLCVDAGEHKSDIVWTGMLHSVPEEYLNMFIKPISGCVAENLDDSDIITIELTKIQSEWEHIEIEKIHRVKVDTSMVTDMELLDKCVYDSSNMNELVMATYPSVNSLEDILGKILCLRSTIVDGEKQYECDMKFVGILGNLFQQEMDNNGWNMDDFELVAFDIASLKVEREIVERKIGFSYRLKNN